MDVKRIRPFRPDDLKKLHYHKGQVHILDLINEIPDGPQVLLDRSPVAISFYVNNELVGCFGIMDNRYAWAAFSESSGKHMLYIAKRAKSILNQVGAVWTYNRVNDQKGRRWCELIGFTNEGLAKVDGEPVDYVRYLRARHGN